MAESLLRLRAKARQLLNLPEKLPWWQRRNSNQSAAQISFGINVFIVAVGVPLVWRWTVNRKQKATVNRNVTKDDSSTLELERLAVEMIVNQRRTQNGLPPYPYDSKAGSHHASNPVFDSVLAEASRHTFFKGIAGTISETARQANETLLAAKQGGAMPGVDAPACKVEA